MHMYIHVYEHMCLCTYVHTNGFAYIYTCIVVCTGSFSFFFKVELFNESMYSRGRGKVANFLHRLLHNFWVLH